jgi:hypothetical protein
VSRFLPRPFIGAPLPAHHLRARRAAFAAFQSDMPGATNFGGSVIAEHRGMCIVRVCCSDSRPPGRKFYLVPENGIDGEELPFDGVRGHGVKAWR